MHEEVDAVRAAVIAGDVRLLESAEIALESACRSVSDAIASGNYDAAQLRTWQADCYRLAALIAAGHEFYAGLTAAIKVQLHGYCPRDDSGRAKPPSSFVLEA